MGTPQTQSHHQQQHANNATMRDHTAAQARAAQRLKELWKNVPLTPEQMIEVKRLVRLVPDLAAIGLVAPPAPLKLVPSNLEKVPAEERLATLQAFVDGFQYNHTGSTYFCLRKNRPLSAIIATAKQMARDRLPIKCLEATFLGLHITSGLDDWERIPVGFKTQVEPPDGGATQTWRHIVLAIRDRPSGKFGALGLSRRVELAGKPMVYDSLSALLLDYKQSYEQWWHTVLKMRIGLPVEHDGFSPFPVCWRCLCVRPDKQAWDAVARQLDAFPKHWRRLSDKWKANPGRKPSARVLASIARSPYAQSLKANGKGRAKNHAAASGNMAAVRSSLSASSVASLGESTSNLSETDDEETSEV